jgi:putative ABC transport system ATP-binding protein
MLPMDFSGHYSSLREQRERALSLLEQVEIADHFRKLPAALSGGQQQRLAIARAMANDPDVLVADEPTGSLDSATANTVVDIFENLVQQGRTILLVTHDKDIARRGSRRITLFDGKLIDDEGQGRSNA